MAYYRKRKRGQRYAKPSQTTESTQKYIQNKVQKWLYCAVEHEAQIDSRFFDCLCYAQNGLHGLVGRLDTLLQNAAPQLVQKRELSFSKDKQESLYEELKHTHHKRYASFLEDVWDDHPEFQQSFKEIILKTVAPSKNLPLPLEIATIRKKITAYLGCSGPMLDFLEFVHCLRTIPQIEYYFEDVAYVHKKAHQALLAKILDMPLDMLCDTLLEAYACGFMKDERGCCFKMAPLLQTLWDASGVNKLDDLLYIQLAGRALPLEDYHLPTDTVAHVRKLLSSDTAEPVHVLLYGAAGTGKTSFAKSLAKSLNVKAWAVASGTLDDNNSRRTALVACTRMAAKNKGSFVLVDEAERLLDTDFSGLHETKDKAWLNAFLEQHGRRIIWITNHISHIDLAVRRRFSFSIHFEALTEKQRHAAWSQILKDEKVVSRIRQEDVKTLVRNYPVAVAVIHKAIAQAKILQEPKSTFAKAVERVLEAHVTLEHDGETQKKRVEQTQNYTLEGVTLAKGQEHSISNIMEKAHKIDGILKQGTLPKGGGSMLFYGPPGTGKSALAQHMAKELKRDCVIKKASDLLSMYVGGSEQNIAHAFQSAEENGDVLVIDEADSFIYSRESATRSWEVTQVNEFLTQLEEYKGLCICTSNRRESMDMAAMRRFSFKIAFDYAGKEQIEKLYLSILAPLCKKNRQKMTATEKNSLLFLSQLTPGDFAAVRSQYWLDDDITHATLINALVREQKSKLDHKGKMLGFR